MQVVRGLETDAGVRGGFVAIGNFDGVHLGHRRMMDALREHARAAGVKAVAMTFDPPPVALLRPDALPPALTTLERKLELLAETGVDVAVVYPTDRALLQLTAEEFFTQIVQGGLGARGLVEGPNFYFGRNRAGSVETLRRLCDAAGLFFEVVRPVMAGDQMVSSTEIRGRLLAGDVAGGARMLGQAYRLAGRVVRGAERGRTLGFPTANLEDVQTVIPGDGVYAGRAWVGGACYAGAMNIGPNPTFGEGARKLEVHLLDFAGDLYGKRLEYEFLERLRETVRFSGLDALQARLADDIARTRQIVLERGQSDG